MVYLIIDSAEQLPAAEAVIQAMYGVPGAISSLEQQQLVYAVVIADMLDVQAGQQAQEALTAAAMSNQGLAAEALQVLADLAVWPACLLQLLPVVVAHAPCCAGGSADLAAIRAADPGSRLQRLLVAALGDLQAVWADARLTAVLLQLPLPAMQLLLSSDRLHVPSQDTVLYTARRFMQAQAQKGREVRAAVRKALSPLIRAPHLSKFILSLNTLPASDCGHPLSAYQPALRRLQQLKRIASQQEVAAAVQQWDGVPASWHCPVRILRPLEDGVRLDWWLPVEQLKQACMDSCGRQDAVWLRSPGSPPLNGIAWGLRLECETPVGGGTLIGLYVGPVAGGMPPGGFYKFRATFQSGSLHTMLDSPCLATRDIWGIPNCLELQPMAGGGWDEAVWAAAGLPATGVILLQLHMHSVE